jgi:hypothetical protein
MLYYMVKNRDSLKSRPSRTNLLSSVSKNAFAQLLFFVAVIFFSTFFGLFFTVNGLNTRGVCALLALLLLGLLFGDLFLISLFFLALALSALLLCRGGLFGLILFFLGLFLAALLALGLALVFKSLFFLVVLVLFAVLRLLGLGEVKFLADILRLFL